MATNTKEIGFEAFIEAYLLAPSIGYRKRLSSNYDKDLCMDTELLLEFIRNTQEKAWGKLVEQYGEERARERFLSRVSDEIHERGFLDVFRNGIKDSGASFSLAYFKPNTAFNPESLELYQGNILSITRQLKYSKKNENSIDMVLSLNGLPFTTVELKNQMTGQSIEH